MGHQQMVSEARCWSNYETDYRPLVQFSTARGISSIATNIPRRHASIVARDGLQALEEFPDDVKQWIAPLPIPLDCESPTYQDLLNLSAAHGIEAKKFLAAQAIKDATMAHFILRNFSAGNLFLHINGDHHSRRFGGICWYLKQYRSDISVVTLSSVEEASLEFQEGHAGLADCSYHTADLDKNQLTTSLRLTRGTHGSQWTRST